MAGSTAREAARETRLELTPMIDVTFLLLVFFLCSIRFKVLEGKLSTFLPKDVGTVCSAVPMTEWVDVRLERATPVTEAQRRAWRDDSAGRSRGLKVWMLGKPVSDCDELARWMSELRRKVPIEDATGVDPLKVKVEPGANVVYDDVVRVLDAITKAGLREVSFRGLVDE